MHRISRSMSTSLMRRQHYEQQARKEGAKTRHCPSHPSFLAVARGRDSTQSSWGRFQRHAAKSAPGFGRNCASTTVLLVLEVED
ncbi:hypothetical protein V8C44DRAFT_340428 [Trichoderma aethiopicum]